MDKTPARDQKATSNEQGLQSSCSTIDEKPYQVNGANGNIYQIKKVDALPHLENLCPLMCSNCEVCVHSFTCTCIDESLHSTIFKHIHLVVQALHKRDGITCPNDLVARPEVATEDCLVQAQMETQNVLASFGRHSYDLKEK